jgi:hypothetical protein
VVFAKKKKKKKKEMNWTQEAILGQDSMPSPSCILFSEDTVRGGEEGHWFFVTFGQNSPSPSWLFMVE